jgi:8-oxo-dGTP pyrophosphatase MutT (NUDIX family)
MQSERRRSFDSVHSVLDHVGTCHTGTIGTATCFPVFGEHQVKFKQFAALPYRTSDANLKILLITTRKKRRWSVPKGWPMKRRKPHETAATEAYEEAGVRGAVARKQIGQFKKRRMKKKRSVLCAVGIFPLQVKRTQQNWPEKFERSRIWVAPREAARLVNKRGLRRAIMEFERLQQLRRSASPEVNRL